MNLPYFDKDATARIKGVALIMMFFYHFFTFPGWWIGGVSYPALAGAAQYISEPCRMCVAVFCFLTGYFYAFAPNKSYRYSCRKIVQIIIPYWAVFLPFVLIAAVFAAYRCSFIGFLLELFAWKYDTMVFCWYVSFYITAILLMPVCRFVLDRGVFQGFAFAFLLIPFCFRTVNSLAAGEAVRDLSMALATFLPVMMSGYLFGKNGWFEKVFSPGFNRAPGSVKPLLYLVSAVAACIMRWCVPSVSVSIDELPFVHIKPIVYCNLDVLYAPVFVFSVLNLNRLLHTALTDRILRAIGKYSLLMWFVSCLFFNNSREIFQPLLYWPRLPVLVLIWGLALCWGIAAVLDIPVRRLLKLYDSRRRI